MDDNASVSTAVPRQPLLCSRIPTLVGVGLGIATFPIVFLSGRSNRKGTNGVSTNGVTANFMFLTERLFGYSRQTTFTFPKVTGRTFLPNLSKTITFAAAPLVLTSFVRNQSNFPSSPVSVLPSFLSLLLPAMHSGGLLPPQTKT